MTVDENGIQVLPDDNQQSSETPETVSQVTTASGIDIGEEAKKAMSRDTANDQESESVEGGSASTQSANGVLAPSGEEWYYLRAEEIQNEHPDWTTDQITDKMSEEIWNNNYHALMEDIAHSKTPAERDAKIEQYKSQLLEYYVSGIDVDNDVEYLREVQGVEPQYRLSPDNPAFVDAILSFQDRANGYDLEDNENHIKWRIKPSGAVHPDDWDNYLIQQEYNQSIQTVSDNNVINSENVHKLLDVAGLFPAAGAVPDLGNSALYLFEGNYEESRNSAIAAVPFAGDYFAVAVKGSKLFKGVDETRKARLGGAYKDVPANGGQVHHMPADSASPYSRREGPSIRMEIEDHMKTNSWGSSKKAVAYRANQKELIEQGKFKEALQMDVNEIKGKFGNKYDEHLNQMDEYANELLKNIENK